MTTPIAPDCRPLSARHWPSEQPGEVGSTIPFATQRDKVAGPRSNTYKYRNQDLQQVIENEEAGKVS